MKISRTVNFKVLLIGCLARFFVFYYYWYIPRRHVAGSLIANEYPYHWTMINLLAGPGKDIQALSQCAYIHVHSKSPNDILPLSSSLFCESLSHALTAMSIYVPSNVVGFTVSVLSDYHQLVIISFILQLTSFFLMTSLEDEHISDEMACHSREDKKILENENVHRCANKQLSFASSVYWLNPAIMFGMLLSPLPFITHMLILVSLRSAVESRRQNRRKSCIIAAVFMLLTCLCSFVLVCISPQFFILVPALMVLLSKRGYIDMYNDDFSMNRFTFALTMYAVLLGCAQFWLNLDPISHLKRHMYGQDIHSYSPSISFSWYLCVQIFEENKDFYARLLYLQPFIFMVPLLIRLYSWSLEILYILIAILFMYKPDTTICDIIFVFCVLMLNFRHVFIHVKYLSVLLVLILIPLVSSPVMLYLWVDLGTANANYFFFQSLMMWASYAMLIVQYTKALVLREQQNAQRNHSDRTVLFEY